MSLLLALQVAGGPVNYADSLSAGTYTVSGKTITDSVARIDNLSTGAYAVSGKSITDSVARVDSLSVGAYVVSGKTITDVVTSGTIAYADNLSVGAYTVSGIVIIDLLARNDSLSVGAYTVTGNQITDDYQHVTEEGLGGGSGYPVYGKYERPKGIGEFLDIAMSEIYEAGTDKELPIETREAFAKVIKPYTKSKEKIPNVEKIDWKTFEDDITRIEQMMSLWQQVLDDEEVIIMAYLNYYH